MQHAAQANAEFREAVVVRLLRRWVAARECEGIPLQSIIELSASLGVSAEAAVALDSFFQVTEGVLERRLETECCCSRDLSSDERAVLLSLAAAPEFGAPVTSAAMPYGLCAPLAWAAASARRLLGHDQSTPDPVATRQCAFAKS